MTLEEKIKEKMHSDVRELVLEQIEGKTVKSSVGMVDSRLFKGGNSVHVAKDPQNYLWSVKYAVGSTPEPLRQRFTTFSKLLEFATGYFQRRGLRIKEVLDR